MECNKINFHIDTIPTEAVLTPYTCQLTSVSPSFSSARGAECAAESPQRRRSWRCSPRRRGSFHGPRAVTQLRESRSLSSRIIGSDLLLTTLQSAGPLLACFCNHSSYCWILTSNYDKNFVTRSLNIYTTRYCCCNAAWIQSPLWARSKLQQAWCK